ncbi:hypothetical protein FHR70_000735 [Microvirga lupini]|uniref:Uncharacterized protein n=1 Tax=Microvirga lupini TaxID=420324 RepID=A0A7W4VI78_9HYPH|nr:hypothetical protein [Microvirga lupini]MBB3017695.1 hypothetical protein [Microvirga lupini]
MTLIAQQRQKSLDTWLAARGEAGRIIAEYGKRSDWEAWANEQVSQSPHERILRRMLADQLVPKQPLVLL